MSNLLQLFVGSLVPASLYALIGIGFVIVYKTTRVLNFAQGQLCLLGGYITYALTGYFAGHFGWALFGLLVIGLVVGAVIYLALLNPLKGQGPLIMVMLTIILGIIIQAVGGILWGTDPKFLPTPFSLTGIDLGAGVVISQLDLAIIVTAAVVLAVLWLGVRFTRAGVAMRAAAEHPTLASHRGVNVTLIATAAWSIATVTAFLAGVAIGLRSSVDISVVGLGFVGFSAILIGGMDSIPGVLAGSLILAFVQNVATSFLGGQWSDVVAYVLLLAVLLVRPYGLFGTREFLRV